MNTYEQLLFENNGLSVIEKHFKSIAKGLCKGRKIGISKDIPTVREKSCILAEELGHFHTTTGNILDQSKVENRKQERTARLWAYAKMINMTKLAEAKRCGCRNRYEVAEYLDVTEEFLQEALDSFKEIYGTGYHQHGDYLICFEPLNIYCISE